MVDPEWNRCAECGKGIVWKYLPKHESRDLCLACLDAVEPFWREKQLGIKVIDNRARGAG
jgi:hypothetical protein